MDKLNKLLLYKIMILIIILLLSFIFSISMLDRKENMLFNKLLPVVGVISEYSGELEIQIMKQLKSGTSQYSIAGKDILNKYGYKNGRFIFIKDKTTSILLSLIFSFGITFLCFISMEVINRNKKRNTNRLREYLEEINKGNYYININIDEDFAIASDELYKTVLTLRELKEKAIKDKVNLKDNIADISHQLKTPITSINLMTQLLEDGESKNENQEYIDKLKKQIERLELLTNSLLTMSKLDADIKQFKEEIVDLNNIINLTMETVIPLIEKKAIEISIVGEDAYIKGDIHWLIEAFLNIIKNCIEHTDYGGQISITISSNPIFKEIMIEDNGIGFVKEDIPYIFDRFYKGKNSDKDSIGIGLSMSKAIIEKHGGEIIAENKTDGGARFKIKFYL